MEKKQFTEHLWTLAEAQAWNKKDVYWDNLDMNHKSAWHSAWGVKSTLVRLLIHACQGRRDNLDSLIWQGITSACLQADLCPGEHLCFFSAG